MKTLGILLFAFNIGLGVYLLSIGSFINASINMAAAAAVLLKYIDIVIKSHTKH